MRSTIPCLVLATLFALAGCTRDAGSDGLAPAGAAVAPSEPLYRVPVDDDLPSMGDARAPVTIVAFVDYECPYCRRAEVTIDKLRASYGSEVRLVAVEH